MERKLSSLAATAALIACSVCHVWTLLQLLRDVVDREQARASVYGPGLPCILLYIGAVCLFNWFAPDSGSRPYRRVALAATGLHLAAALLQGVSARTVLASEWDGIGRLGVILFSAVNLPLDSVRVIAAPSSMIPWLISLLFAFHLTVVVLRMCHSPE